MSTNKDIIHWQYKILPFAIVFLCMLVVFFIVLYIIEIQQIQNSFLSNKNYDVVEMSKMLNNKILKPEEKMYNAELITLLNRHYHAAIVVRSRVLTINLSFLTGMILCFMGGLFVLGKFTERDTNINGGNKVVNISLSSSSPGIILSCLGVLLIAISIFSKADLTIEDRPVYIGKILEKEIPGEEKILDSSQVPSLNTLKEITNGQKH